MVVDIGRCAIPCAHRAGLSSRRISLDIRTPQVYSIGYKNIDIIHMKGYLFARKLKVLDEKDPLFIPVISVRDPLILQQEATMNSHLQ